MTEGRRGVGTVSHCMDGADVIVERVADWRPFSCFTLRGDVAGVDNWAWTHQLDPMNGTRLTMRISDPGGYGWAQIGTGLSASVANQAGQLEAPLAGLSEARMLE